RDSDVDGTPLPAACSLPSSRYSDARFRCDADRFSAGGLGVAPARADDVGRFCDRFTAAEPPASAGPACGGDCGGPSSSVIGLSPTDGFFASSSVGAGGTTITVGLRCISTTTTTSSATVAEAPASAAHFNHPGAPARPGATMIGCGGGVGFDGVTATPPNVSTSGLA